VLQGKIELDDLKAIHNTFAALSEFRGVVYR